MHRTLLPTATLLASATLLSASSASAQTMVPYFKNQFSQPFVPLMGGTNVTFQGGNDDGEAQVPIGFSFEFYGQMYTQVNVSTNGYIALATPCTMASQCPGFGTCTAAGACLDSFLPLGAPNPSFPNTGTPQGVVAAVWDDLNLSSAGSVTYATEGTAPNRSFVIQWLGVPHFPNTQSNATWQIRLSEASGAVRIHYGMFNAVASENTSWSWANGIENELGTVGEVGTLPCGTTNACQGTDLTALNNTVIEWVGPAGVELVPSGTAPTGANPGDTIQVDVVARNVGTMTATAGFTAAVYFSTDASIETTDTLLGTVMFAPGLASRSAVTQTLTTTAPSVMPGFYTIGVILDSANTVAEDIETNNTIALTNTFLVGSDLSVEVDTPPDSGPGETVPLTARILNLGAAQAAVPLRLYLSQDPNLDPADTQVVSATVAVGAQPSTEFVFPTVIPTITPGNYYLIAEVDAGNTIVEADETNNITASDTTTVLQGPDLVAEDVSSPATFAFRGAQLEVAVEIENIGLASATGLFYGLYFSENALCSAVSDTQLAQIGPVNVGPGETLTATHMVDVPATIQPIPHILCLIVNANGAVLEGRQNNNIARTLNPIDVRDPQPDFQVTEIRLPERAAAGESVTIQRTFLNDGNAMGMADYEVYLSEDTAFDMQDILLGSGTTMLDPATEDVDVDTLFVPATVASGGYYVIYRVDPADAVSELFEDNNDLVSGGVVAVLPSDLLIQTPTLPIGTTGVAYDVFLSAAGGSGGYMWSLSQGTLPAGLALEAGTGRLSGTPTEEGQFSLTVQVTDGALVAQRSYELLVSAPTDTLEVLTRALPPGFVNRAYEIQLTAFGGVPPYTWSSTGLNELPEGFTLSETGLLRGLPTDTTLAGLTLRVTDALGAFAERPLVLRVVQANDSVRLSNDVLPDGRLGEVYDETIRVASGTGSSPFSFEVASGALPDGLTFDGDRIFGTPERVGLFSFEVRVSDSRGDFDVNRYIVEIDEGEGVTFVTNALPAGTVDAPYVDAEGAAVVIRAVSPASTGTISISVVAGEVPPGLVVGTDGSVIGTPTMQGTFSFTVRASDDLGQSDLRAYGVVVAPAPVVVDPPDLGDGGGGCVCVDDEDSGAPAWSLALLLGVATLGWRRRRGLLGLLVGAFVLGAPLAADAQTGIPYFQDTRTETYTERSSCQAVTFQFGNDDSDAQITLPFPFRFFGQDQTTVNMGTNGWARFGGSATSLSNTAMPNTSSSNLVIAPWWDDLITASACTSLEGTAPNRIFILQWTQVTRFSGASGNPKFQIWLYEGPGGRFEVRYGPGTGISATGWTASAGYDGPSGSDGGEFLACTSPSCDGATLAAAENMVVRVQADAGTDLSAAGIDVPPIVYAGVSFPTTALIQSLHQNPLGPVRYAVHVIGPNETVPNNQIYLSPPVTVQPYQALTVTPQPTVPLTLPNGRYRLALVVDPLNELMEPDEGNNVFISTDTFRLAQPQPDFVVAGITPSMSTVEPGATFSVTMGLRNRGNLDGTSDWRLVLSRNQVVSPEDLELASGTEALPLVTTSSVTVQVNLPSSLGAGQYYLGVVMDPDNLVREIDEVNNFGIGAEPLSVASNAVSVATTALPGAYLGVEYTHFLRASGGDGDYTWSIDSGALPAGVSLVPSTGELRGRPTMVEEATVTVRVESAGQSATQSLDLDVVEPDAGLSIVTRALLPGVVGQAYPPRDPEMPNELQRIRVVGATGEVTFTLEGDAPGLELTPDGVLRGTPSRAGTFTFDVTAQDGGDAVTRSLSLFVGEPGILALVPSELPEARLGVDYIFDLRVVGQSATATVTFTQNGPLPPGIVVTSDGRILGTPEQVGVFAFSVTASEGMGQDAASDSATFRLTVVPAGDFDISPTTLPFATVGEMYEEELGTRGGTPPLSWRIFGPPLPNGLEFEVAEVDGEERLRFRGTPVAAATVTVLVTVTDSQGRRAEAPVTLEVREPVEVVMPPVMTDGGCRAGTADGALGALALLGLLGLARRRR